MEERADLGRMVDFARARMERLEAEELRTLAAATGDHLPLELAHRLERLRAERLVLLAGELWPAA